MADLFHQSIRNYSLNTAAPGAALWVFSESINLCDKQKKNTPLPIINGTPFPQFWGKTDQNLSPHIEVPSGNKMYSYTAAGCSANESESGDKSFHPELSTMGAHTGFRRGSALLFSTNCPCCNCIYVQQLKESSLGHDGTHGVLAERK